MPGKPRKTSFPGKTFTVKDGKSLNSERVCLDAASIFTAHSAANLFCRPAVATDRLRDVLI